MIYNVFTNFKQGNVNYDPDNTNVAIPIDGLVSFMNNKVKRETTKVKEMEENFSKYQTSYDDLLGLEIHNGEQYKKVQQIQQAAGLTKDSFNIGLEDLNNKAKILQIQNSVKKVTGSGDYKRILEDQKKAKDFLAEADKIASQNEVLSIMAKNDYLNSYASKEEKDYMGFRLNIDEYKPIDIDQEIANIAKDIDQEYEYIEDPSSPNGYVLINKISRASTTGQEVFDMRFNQLKANKRFKNNLNSYLAINDPDTDYNNPETYKNFLDVLAKRYLADKVVSSELKAIKPPAETKTGTTGTGSTGSGSSSGSAGTGANQNMTQSEQKAYNWRKNYEQNPDYKDYDFSEFQMIVQEIPNFIKTKEEIDPDTKDLVITYEGKDGKPKKLRIPKMKNGASRVTVESQEQVAAPVDSTAQAPAATTPAPTNPGVTTKDDPERAKAVADLGLKKNSGGMDANGQWVYNGDVGEVVIIKKPKNVQESGLKSNNPDHHLDANTADKAKNFHDDLAMDYTITEAGVDSLNKSKHKAKGHYNGTAYDFKLKGDNAGSSDAIINTILKAKKNGLKAVYEPGNIAHYNETMAKLKAYDVKNGTDYSKTAILHPSVTKSTGNHFSVYNNESVQENTATEGWSNWDELDNGASWIANNVQPTATNSIADYRKHMGKLPANADGIVVARSNMDYFKNKYKNAYKEFRKYRDFGAEYEKGSKNQIFEEETHSILGANMMGILMQSSKLAEHIESKPQQIWDLTKFVESPAAQEQYMENVLMPKYEAVISKADKEKTDKYSEAEKYYILHHDGIPAGKANLNVGRYRSGRELLEKYMIDEDGNFKSGSDALKKALNSITSETERGLLKIAYNKLEEGDLDVMGEIARIEANPAQYGENGVYRIGNSNSTAVGKYQIMWSQHYKEGSELYKMLQEKELPEKPVTPAKKEVTNTDNTVKSDSLSNDKRFQ